MTSISLRKDSKVLNANIVICGSKSESNRMLILQNIIEGITLENLSDSDDTRLLQKALSSTQELINISHAGTAMRFLTAYFSVKQGSEVVLTGSTRMQNRPIGILVDALRTMGANITYEDKQGYPPLRIKGVETMANTVTIDGGVSSQYLSAILLIASVNKGGFTMKLTGNITSIPYLKMTLSLLESLGVKTNMQSDTITIEPSNSIVSTSHTVESDWSSASYYYSAVALSPIGSLVVLSSYNSQSLQGDSVLASIYKSFGVETTFTDKGIVLSKTSDNIEGNINLDLVSAPDIAQTIAVTAFGLSVNCKLTGLHTLKIKETDRLVALRNELTKLGASIAIDDNSLELKSTGVINDAVSIKTYDDHRMAMAFAPLMMKTDITIENHEVVTKSYPRFWDDFMGM
ncbi:MAG: 3-phosphoshikimate 1-carboxyvinyltransferase [Flavobacteriaceae bacterium]|nr:3-phosphoshikimate 1-carboxyvinyltransferase [Flavobacteriaceae bacterium]